uniref:Uncharacterized protein n=1 Tax=viral metagenome TaxID=1070528 RepID=A0A6H2A5F0_9ZZZZ
MEKKKTDKEQQLASLNAGDGYMLSEGFVKELKCTVRTCIDCGALVSGGPTRCGWCAELSIKSKCKRKLIKWLLGV